MLVASEALFYGSTQYLPTIAPSPVSQNCYRPLSEAILLLEFWWLNWSGISSTSSFQYNVLSDTPLLCVQMAHILSPAEITLLAIWFSSIAVVPSMGFSNVGTLRPAIVFLNDCDIGSTFDDCQKHQSLKFVFEQHSPLR